jgi:putative hydrolase of the HAD superfamily
MREGAVDSVRALHSKKGERRMDEIRVISFDLDGTITDASFVDSVWLEGIPRAYALKKGFSFEEAKRDVEREYNKVGRERLEWYDLDYWIKTLGLDVSSKGVLNHFEDRIRTFPEVPEVLAEIRDRGFRLIMITNARREFVDLELEKTSIGHYFERVFSSTSDFGLIKKSVGLYQRVCNICKIAPQEMVHVGDDRLFDFEVPTRLGILAFYLDRTGRIMEGSVIHSLKELNEKLANLI